MERFDVVIVGGGHAGSEAAHAAARLGCRVALVTLEPERIGFLSCNPAMGGLAKGQLIKEIDALGGLMGRVTDRSAIQYRQLNSSKGPAVRSSRAQCDKELYSLEMRRVLGDVTGLTIISGEVVGVRLEGSQITSVTLGTGEELSCKAVVITSGTFLKAVMLTGFEKTAGGRVGDRAADELSSLLTQIGFRLRRLKTGTPPRLKRQSIDFSKMEEQPGDAKPVPFSFFDKLDRFPYLPQVSCHITYTNSSTHEIIAANFDRSPMFTGLIKGVGPRYCPSIEDKVKRFAERDRHQLFIEPEGLNTDSMYINGISTSLPHDVQEKFVRSVSGLENAEFLRYGYAVEYDAVDSRQLKATLEAKDVSGLFFAGQVNGTSGYEEAGAQGLIAGINAARIAKGESEPFVLTRSDAYIGVLIDDLVLRGSDEPYRMFTSRAEYRLLLREDNADLRLSAKGYAVGLLSEDDFLVVNRKAEGVEKLRSLLAETYYNPGAQIHEFLATRGEPETRDRVSGEALLRRPSVCMEDLRELSFSHDFSKSVEEQVEIQIKYDGYIKRDLALLETVKKSEEVKIPLQLDYGTVPGLSAEIVSKLGETRPETLGQAGRVPGVTPAAVANLLIFLRMADKKPA